MPNTNAPAVPSATATQTGVAPTSPASLQDVRPRLKPGQAFVSDARVIWERIEGAKQVTLPAEIAPMLSLLDGTRSIPQVIEELQRRLGRVPFKSFFGSLQKLQAQGFLENAESLADQGAQARAEMFEREPVWISRPIFSLPIIPRMSFGRPSLLAFYVFAAGSALITLLFLFNAYQNGHLEVPGQFLFIDNSHALGLVFLFAACSILISAKTLFKALLSILLTGRISQIRLELNLFSLALRSHDETLYLAGDRWTGILAMAGVGCSQFFFFAIASGAAPQWSLLTDLFWVSMLLALVDLNPFRRSELSSFFNIVYNQSSAAHMLPYLKNRGLFASIGRKDQLADQGIYTAYSILAILWVMTAYNLFIHLLNRNYAPLASSLHRGLSGDLPLAELVASGLILGGLVLMSGAMVIDLLRTLSQNVLHPLSQKRIRARASRATTSTQISDPREFAATLKDLPLFQGLAIESIQFLLGKGSIRQVPPEVHVIIQETDSDELFILLDGEVAIQKRHPTGATSEIARLRPITIFGENTLMENARRSADVVATATTRLIAIPRSAVEELRQMPEFKHDFDQILDRLMLGQYIGSSELFREAPREAVSVFLNAGELMSLPSGRPVIEQGRSDKDFYLLVRGSVDVIHDGRVIKTLQQGDFFGEMALILNAPRNSTVMTRENCRLLKLSADAFWGVLSQHASLALFLETISEMRQQETEHNGTGQVRLA